MTAALRLTHLLLLVGVIGSCATPVSVRDQASHAVWQPSARLAPAADRDGLTPQVFDLARRAYDCGKSRGYFEKSILTVIDYSLPSTEPRLWVLDLDSGEVLFHELVAHGRNSGENFAVAFSNLDGSKQSSLGLYRTGDTYEGKHGYSLRLSGLEPGVNDRARERAIVMHAADYATREFAEQHGRLGRSWGCPALDPRVHHRVIDTIKGGTALFAYYPDRAWLGGSKFLDGHCAAGPPLAVSAR